MELKVIGSSSSGNCYLLYNNTETLIIELGFTFKVIKQSLNYDLKNVVGALVTHAHSDHFKGVKETLLAGIDVYMSQGTASTLPYHDHRIKIIKHGEAIKIGGFEVLPFDVIHDVVEPLGFLIRHDDTGLICFITDCQFSPFIFPGVNHYLIESNYCPEILKQRAAAGLLHSMVEQRVIKSHMSLPNTKLLLKENDLSEVINIVLLHLSDSNSDAARFKREVEQQTAKTTYIATKGLLIYISLNPF